jgi:hypothetical protein
MPHRSLPVGSKLLTTSASTGQIAATKPPEAIRLMARPFSVRGPTPPSRVSKQPEREVGRPGCGPPAARRGEHNAQRLVAEQIGQREEERVDDATDCSGMYFEAKRPGAL